MKQLLIFQEYDEHHLSAQLKKESHCKLYVDGASRNNPGPAGAGIYFLKDGIPLEQQGFFLGTKTNNQAEYLALLIGLFYAQKHMTSNDFLEVISDSQLLIRHLQGAYKVKHSDLIPLHAAAKKILLQFNHATLHVLRHENTHADALANDGIDKKNTVPDECRNFLLQYNISI